MRSIVRLLVRLVGRCTIKVEGSGKLTANINAPKGTDVTLEGGGLFKKTEVSRQAQMAPARPAAGAAVAGHGTAL
jgi:hypothetical protein